MQRIRNVGQWPGKALHLLLAYLDMGAIVLGDCGLQPESTLESVVRAALQYFKNKLPLGVCLKVPVL